LIIFTSLTPDTYLGLAEKKRKAERVGRRRGQKGIMVQEISVK
jgi:hypothetical protein